MSRPSDTCPECGAKWTRSWIWPTSAGVEHRQCLAGHEWSGEAQTPAAGEPGVVERITNLEAAVSELLRLLADTWSAQGLPVFEIQRRIGEASARFETRRPT